MLSRSSPPTMMHGRRHSTHRGSRSMGWSVDRLVHDRVEHGDDLAVDLDRVGDQDHVARGTRISRSAMLDLPVPGGP